MGSPEKCESKQSARSSVKTARIEARLPVAARAKSFPNNSKRTRGRKGTLSGGRARYLCVCEKFHPFSAGYLEDD